MPTNEQFAQVYGRRQAHLLPQLHRQHARLRLKDTSFGDTPFEMHRWSLPTWYVAIYACGSAQKS